MKKHLYLACSILCLACSAEAAEWYAAAQTADGNTVYLVDKASIKGPKSNRKFWSMMIQGGKQGYTLWHYQVDCSNSEITDLEYIAYKNDAGDVDVSIKPNTKSSLVPDSVLEDVSKTVCSGRHNGATAKKVDVTRIKAQLKSSSQ